MKFRDESFRLVMSLVIFSVFAKVSAYAQTPMGEVGRVNLTQATSADRFIVDLQNSYVNPIVVIGSVTQNDLEPLSARIVSKDSSSFTFFLQEWENLDGVHAEECVSYMVIEAGHHSMPSGLAIEAGSLSSSSAAVHSEKYSQTFTSAPLVFATVSSENDSATCV